MEQLKVWKGRPNPLGASVTPLGVNFALFSENATGVDLCLFDDLTSPMETVRLPLFPSARTMSGIASFPD